MKLEIKLTKVDLYDFYKFHEWYSPSNKVFRLKSRLYYGIFMFSTPFLFFNLSYKNFTIPIFLNLSAIAIFLFFVGCYIAKLSIMWRIEKRLNAYSSKGKNHDTDSELIIEFSDDEIIYNQKDINVRVKTITIEEIKNENQYYYIYFKNLSPIIIPKRVLKSPSEVIEFEDWIKGTFTNTGTA